jgi:hypothetical protein
VIVRRKLNKTKSASWLYLQRANARLFVTKRTRTSTRTCSRSYFYLWIQRDTHLKFRESKMERAAACARALRKGRTREGERDGEERAGEGQRVRESERQREERARNVALNSEI